jgi:copper transport protein
VVLSQAPSVVQLYFNERVDLVGRGVRVVAPSGRRVEGPAQLSGTTVSVRVAASELGTYLVIWRVVATDTHPAQGMFAFSVGRSSNPPDGATIPPGGGGSQLGLVLEMLARALHFLGYALSIGVFAFRQMVLVPLGLTADAHAERRVWRLIGTGVIALLLAEPFALMAQTVSLSGGATAWFDLELVGGALDSSFGRVLAQRLGAAVLLWALVGAARNAHVREGRTAWIVLFLGAAVAVVDGEAAHAVGTRPVWFGLLINTLHEAAMGLWVGALLGLLGVWRLPGVTVRHRELTTRAARIAVVSLTVLITTGTVMALQHFSGLRDLTATAYGRTLVVKLGVLVAILLLAMAARRVPLDRRPRWWAREVALLCVVITLAGLLVSVAPPR